MKLSKSVFLVIVLIGITTLSFGQKNQNQQDLEAIKAVIFKETTSFYKVDYKNWADTWHQVPYAYWSYSDSTGTSYVEGWNALTKTFDEYFRTQKPSNAIVENEYTEIRVYGTGAYARFIQRVKDEIDRDETSQIRVLEKKDGKWKVVCVGAIAKYPKEMMDQY